VQFVNLLIKRSLKYEEEKRRSTWTGVFSLMKFLQNGHNNCI
jgi:hypothetical protein